MAVPNFTPAYSFFSALTATPLRPLHTLVRTTEERFRPSQVQTRQSRPTSSATAHAQSPLRPVVLHERGSGRVPTIVLGGLVPDAPEQVFLLRRFLLRSGDVYYVNYPRDGFSLDALCRELDELATELANAGTPPVIFAVSFGAGIVLEWLRRVRQEGRERLLAGVVLVSPVTCVADLIAPQTPKPTTLLGRALKPYLDQREPVADATVEKSRALFTRMFESGAQNKRALRQLMTPEECERLRSRVMDTIRGVTAEGARQRVQALATMLPLPQYFTPALLPLTEAPALILFAEAEETVLDAAAPVRFALERAAAAYFPQAAVRTVRSRTGTAPVQHASLVFHVFEFLPPLQAFYQCVRRNSLAFAA